MFSIKPKVYASIILREGHEIHKHGRLILVGRLNRHGGEGKSKEGLRELYTGCRSLLASSRFAPIAGKMERGFMCRLTLIRQK